jgi:hypothetical protein
MLPRPFDDDIGCRHAAVGVRGKKRVVREAESVILPRRATAVQTGG